MIISLSIPGDRQGELSDRERGLIRGECLLVNEPLPDVQLPPPTLELAQVARPEAFASSSPADITDVLLSLLEKCDWEFTNRK